VSDLQPSNVSPAELDQMVERLVLETERSDPERADRDDFSDDSLEDVRELANQPPVARYVNLVVREAYDAHASDIHLEATRAGVQARFRLDGILHSAPDCPHGLERAVVSRLKAMAGLDVTERRRPQDGRIRVKLDERELDLRISAIPTVHGESVVLRILDRGGRPVSLDALGMSERALQITLDGMNRPHGLVLVTGPTGSGKTTTLYAALMRRDVTREKIVTVEEPVEYQLEGVTQVPVQRSVGTTFSTALRATLRQDPDVIMIGELRDTETAEIAVQAALTGHLVLATAHTNDALGAIERLGDLGVPQYMLSATLVLLVAQRLVRVLCESCAKEDRVTPDERAWFARGVGHTGPAVVRRAVGCAACRGTGYRGRTAIFEVVRVSNTVRRAIAAHENTDTIRAATPESDHVPMWAEGTALVLAGRTTVEEVLRATRS
jgi:general secretion pathway protein E